MSEAENALGMKLVRIEPGGFLMGSDKGSHDERPVHPVRISQAFRMATTPVTNVQYEVFDPGHAALRGKRGLSLEDDEAVVFVSWHEAVAFCQWLSEKEGVCYRLPTEAEWEYACRAGTSGAYFTGDALPEAYHRNQEEVWSPVPVPLHVGTTPANPWGIRDMHGLVEEWCHDWFGPYTAGEANDPLGREDGLFKVSRGGSHNTTLDFLRSANRLGALPEDKHWLIGFRVVQAERPRTRPLPAPAPKRWATGVDQGTFDWAGGPDPERPFITEPIPYTRIPANPETVPMYAHNHCPSIAWCDNGDLLAVWFSTTRERGREMTILASRLRAGSSEWDLPEEFFKAPDRNMTGSSLYNDGHGRLFFFNGMEAGATWANLALVMRTSGDNGATWTRPRMIQADHQPGNQVISGTIRTREGHILQPCDSGPGGQGGTCLHISRDGGRTWTASHTHAPGGRGDGAFAFGTGKTGAVIAGIHAGVVQIDDGSLLAIGRGSDLPAEEGSADMRMAMSRSDDGGKSWTYSPSPFPVINDGQRSILLRLSEGPVLFVGFTEQGRDRAHPEWPCVRGMMLPGPGGVKRRAYGMFAALTYDGGRTWPRRKLVTPGGHAREHVGGGHTGTFILDDTHAEPMGYLAATQTPDGVIHLLSSRLHYRLNLAWLEGASIMVSPQEEGSG